MNEMNPHIKFAVRGAFFIAAIALMVWALVPEVRPQAAGFLLGLVFSLINGWYLALKAQQVIRIATENTGKPASLGFMVRAALSVLAVYIAMEKESFDVLFTIIGLTYSYVSLIVSGTISLIKYKHL